MVPYDCTVYTSPNYTEWFCELPGRALSVVSTELVGWEGVEGNPGWFSCLKENSDMMVVLHGVCQRGEALLKEMCPADIIFRTATVMGLDPDAVVEQEPMKEVEEGSIAPYLIIGGIFVAALYGCYRTIRSEK